MKGLESMMDQRLEPHLAGYIQCFNSGRYYEAHDVLEDLWLRQGKGHPDYHFHKGLIQLAGAFVHLRLQHLHPNHPKHGGRCAPARRLLLLSTGNLRPYPGLHHGIDVRRVLELAEKTAESIENGSYRLDPLRSPCLTPPVNLA